MDAVKFLEEYSRMCNKYGDCVGCPMEGESLCQCNDRKILHEESTRMVKIVENWSEENPEPEEVGKKYIIEISRMTPLGKFQVKGTHATFTKAELDFFEEYDPEFFKEYKEHDACKACKYEDKAEIEEPCARCRYAYKDKWEATR